MAKKTPIKRRKASTAGPFLALLQQMEDLFVSIEFDWPDEVAADARRRLTRLERAIRHAPENRDRL